MGTVVDEIKERVSIVDVVGQRVALRKSGRSFKGLCPFHTEKTPSFYVFPDRGNYKCFGCGEGGDVFTFVMKTENVSFREALHLLAERAGVSLTPQPQVAAEEAQRAHLMTVTAAAAAYFHNLLLRSSAGEQARSYLERRGVSSGTVEAWQLGYALDSWDALLTYMTEHGYTIRDLLAAGLVVAREGGSAYDRFRHRIIFPIRDIKGHVVGFGARTLGDEQPKYLNSPQTLLFDKGSALYGIDQAREGIRREGRAIIVEGYMDVLICHQMGINNVVATLGTALTERHLAILTRLTKRLILALDPDTAGTEATLRGLDLARETLDREAVPIPTWRGVIRFEGRLDTDIRVLSLPAGKDPDELVRENRDQWDALVQQALPVIEFYIKVLTASADLSNPKVKAAVAERLAPVLNDLADPILRAHYIGRVAMLLQVSENALEAKLRRLHEATSRGPRSGQTAGRAPRRAVPLEDYSLALLLYEPALYWRVTDLAMSPEDFGSSVNRLIFLAFQEYMNANEAFDLALFRDSLDEALRPHLDALVELGNKQPWAGGEDLENALAVTILRLRERQLKAQAEDLHALIQTAEQEGDPVAVMDLMARYDDLRDEIRLVHHALNQRTILWRHRG
jgi:DNA primase